MFLNLNHLNIVARLVTLCFVIHSFRADFDCPEFWSKLEDTRLCYIVLSASWPESYETSFGYCQSYSFPNLVGGLLDLSSHWQFGGLELPLDDANYWVSPRKFQGSFYNLMSGTKVSEDLIEDGSGNCLVLNHFVNGSEPEFKVYPTDCGAFDRPFICALYPLEPEPSDSPEDQEKLVVFKRTLSQCKHLNDLNEDCNKISSKDCKNNEGCEKACCELEVRTNECDKDLLPSSACEQKKSQGKCASVVDDVCGFTCCDAKWSSEVQVSSPCEGLSDSAENGITCFNRAYRDRQCRDDYLSDICAASCCNARYNTDAQALDEINEQRAGCCGGSGEPDGEVSTTHDPCMDFVDAYSRTFCDDAVEDNGKCQSEHFKARCQHTCCIIDPHPCYQFIDELEGDKCYRQLLKGRCTTPGVFKRCRRTCCENGYEPSTASTEGPTTTQEETTSTTTEVITPPPIISTTEDVTTPTTSTEQTTTLGLCGEYADVAGVKCEARVKKGKCKHPLCDEKKCAYSCCMDMINVTTTQPPTTTPIVTTAAPDDKGLDECDHLSDDGPQLNVDTLLFCAAVIKAGKCKYHELRQYCRFSCCMNDYAHDGDNPKKVEPPSITTCNHLEDSSHDGSSDCGTCLEAFTLGRCEETAGCEKTCCLWQGFFRGTACLGLTDVDGYEYCTLNCFDQCEDDTMCEHNCARTVCLYCNNPYYWPSSTETPSVCYGLVNEDSAVDCAKKAIVEKGCVAGYGPAGYDRECNFACCVVYENLPQSQKRNVDLQFLNKTELVEDIYNSSSDANDSIYTDASDRSDSSRQVRHVDSQQERDARDDCFNWDTWQQDPECLQQRAKRQSVLSVLDREFQLEPSIVFTFVLLLVKFTL